jgi:hypothetical protein
MAKKDPAFLFYPEKWLQGTASLMPNEKGVYIDLLAHQHQNKDLPTDIKRLARMAGLSEDAFLPIWEVIKSKFILNKDNRLVNRKLTEVTTERLTKGRTNRITGIFASIIRLSDAPYEIKEKIKKNFEIEPFLPIDDRLVHQKITDWFTERLSECLQNGDQDVININSINKDKNSILVKNSENGKSKFSGNFKAQGEELAAARLARNLEAKAIANRKENIR